MKKGVKKIYYPPNFPTHFENLLLPLLKRLQEEFKAKKPKSQRDFQKLLYRLLARKEFSSFSGRTPPFWWLNFILLRHSRDFSKGWQTEVRKFLTKTKVRSLSGVVTLTLFTQGQGCSFNCVYCPTEPAMPKSYLSDEPAVMRAKRVNFDPYEQTKIRLEMLALSGHPISKVEVIVKGGTFSSYSQKYRQSFIKRVFDAANLDIISQLKTGQEKKVSAKNLSEAQKLNEKAKSRIIGINIETRPDFITNSELRFLRRLGVTHVELGVQALDNKILALIQREIKVKQIAQSTRLLKNVGFKIGYHLMPNLPGTNPELDLKLLTRAFEPLFCPDHIKLYPTIITKYSILQKWYLERKYHPYSYQELLSLIGQFKTKIIPPYVRISRLSRDITQKMMIGEKIPSNLREITQKDIVEFQLKCRCLRCREIKNHKVQGKIYLRKNRYQASKGKEYFLEYMDQKEHSLAFLRLRLPDSSGKIFPVLAHKGLIREVHVYGQTIPVGSKNKEAIQHQNLGANLVRKAEIIARRNGFSGMAVIAGVGVRKYYQKFGYSLRSTYMIKDFVS